MDNSKALKKNRFWFTVVVFTVGLLLVSFALAIEYRVSAPTYYTLPGDPGFQLKIQDGYYVNGTKLVEVDKFILERLVDFWNIALMNPYTMALGFFGILFLFLFVKKMPPPYLWADCLGIKRKQRRLDDPIHLTESPYGIIGLREWGINKDGFLTSTAQGMVWDSETLVADKKPILMGWHGVYAYRLGTKGCCELGSEFFGLFAGVLGIVCLTGHIVGHKDSMLRAEKCTILLLATRRVSNAEKLRQHYKCPVVVVSNPSQALNDWAISSEGIFWLQHNQKLIAEKISEKAENDIAQLPAYRAFGRGAEI